MNLQNKSSMKRIPRNKYKHQRLLGRCDLTLRFRKSSKFRTLQKKRGEKEKEKKIVKKNFGCKLN